jgi:hypothetical protein
LDSGAFNGGLYSRYHSDSLTIQTLEIGNRIEDAARFVTAFFESNLNYYLGRLRADLNVSPTDIPGNAYRAIVSDAGKTLVDDRRATIEIQHQSPIELTRNTVFGIALPWEFLQDDVLRELLVDKWRCKIIPYDLYIDSPVNDIIEIRARVKDALENIQYLKRRSYI